MSTNARAFPCLPAFRPFRAKGKVLARLCHTLRFVRRWTTWTAPLMKGMTRPLEGPLSAKQGGWRHFVVTAVLGFRRQFSPPTSLTGETAATLSLSLPISTMPVPWASLQRARAECFHRSSIRVTRDDEAIQTGTATAGLDGYPPVLHRHGPDGPSRPQAAAMKAKGLLRGSSSLSVSRLTPLNVARFQLQQLATQPPAGHWCMESSMLQDCDHATSVVDVAGTLDGQLVRAHPKFRRDHHFA